MNNRKKLFATAGSEYELGNSYAFVVGINHYPKINSDLRSAVNDAKALAQTLKYRQGFDHVELFMAPTAEQDSVELQKDLEDIKVQLTANGEDLKTLLARIKDPAQEPKIQANDYIVFYYAGHGKPGEFDKGPAGYLLPSDARPEKAMLENDSLLPMEDLADALTVLDCHHTLLILDCCFAGKFRHVGNTRDAGWVTDMPLYKERFKRYVQEKAMQVLVSAGPHQTAADWVGERSDKNTPHSPFAAALIEALEGKAELKKAGKRHGDGVLTSQELYLYLWDKVESLTNVGEEGFDLNIQYPDLFPMGKHKGGQFIFFDPNNPLNFAERVLRNPYKGLQAFKEKDSDLFFGRELVIKELIAKFQKTNVLVLSAPSGSGKSSLAKAGLFPAIKDIKTESETKEWETAQFIILRPGNKPWSGQEAIVKDKEGVEIDRYFTGLALIKSLLKQDGKKVLLLDQYEELFTEGAALTEKEAYEKELLRQYQNATANGLKIIITIRSDFEWNLEESIFGQELWKAENLSDFLYRLPQMGFDELRKALVNPALAELYDFEEDRLIDRILAEVSNAQGALPMLSFTMSQLYEKTDPDERIFKFQAYREMGGVNGALSKYADKVYAELGKKSADHQKIMQKLILRMVKINDNNFGRRRVYVKPRESFSQERRRAFINEFDFPELQNSIVEEVLDILVEKQLISGGTDKIGAYYEPIHQALIQYWKTAKQWIADFGVETLTLQRQLWQDVLDSQQPKKENRWDKNAYGADLEDDLKVDRSLTDNVSKLWATNPKLLQVIGQISYAAKPLMLLEKDAIIAEAMPFIEEEDKATFKKFWDDCYDKEKIPDLNSLILSGYSDKLLEIFLKRGNHWLNHAESDFIIESWQERIRSILDMKRQRDEFKAAQERTATEMIEASWKTGTYLEKSPEASQEASGSWLMGSRDLYHRLKLLMSLKKARSLSPIPIFIKGPHEDDFDLRATTFAYYNPEFLKWAKKHVIPAKKDSTLRILTQPFYKTYFQGMARTYFLVYHFLEKNPVLCEKVKEGYQNLVESGRVTLDFEMTGGGVFLQEEFREYADKYDAEIEQALGVLGTYNWVVGAGFWVRRKIDTTAPLFFEILTDLLQTYDEEWFNNPPQLPESNEVTFI